MTTIMIIFETFKDAFARRVKITNDDDHFTVGGNIVQGIETFARMSAH